MHLKFRQFIHLTHLFTLCCLMSLLCMHKISCSFQENCIWLVTPPLSPKPVHNLVSTLSCLDHWSVWELLKAYFSLGNNVFLFLSCLRVFDWMLKIIHFTLLSSKMYWSDQQIIYLFMSLILFRLVVYLLHLEQNLLMLVYSHYRDCIILESLLKVSCNYWNLSILAGRNSVPMWVLGFI